MANQVLAQRLLSSVATRIIRESNITMVLRQLGAHVLGSSEHTRRAWTNATRSLQATSTAVVDLSETMKLASGNSDRRSAAEFNSPYAQVTTYSASGDDWVVRTLAWSKRCADAPLPSAVAVLRDDFQSISSSPTPRQVLSRASAETICCVELNSLNSQVPSGYTGSTAGGHIPANCKPIQGDKIKQQRLPSFTLDRHSGSHHLLGALPGQAELMSGEALPGVFDLPRVYSSSSSSPLNSLFCHSDMNETAAEVAMASANDRGGCADTAIRSEEHISTDSLERTPLRSVISGTRDHSYSRAGLTCAHKGPEAVVSPGMHRLGKVPRAPCEIHQEPFQQQQRKDSCCTFQECNVSNFPALSFSGSQFLSPGTILGSAAANNESNSTGCRSSRSINTFELISTVSLRRCSSSGAAPDHVPADRHSISACKGRTPRFDDLRLGFCCSHFSVGSGLYATPTSSRETGSNSSRVSNNSCSNGRCKSSTKHAPPWPPQRNFSFSGVTTRSPWNTRICACRPSPVVTANRSSSSSSGLQTLNSEFAGPAPLTCHGQALPDHRSSQCSSSRCSSSSQGCSNSSLWEGELGQAGTRCDSDKQDGTRIAEFDDPLLRLQSLRLRHQPRSPLLLLRCLSSQETDMLQQNGGDMCPLAADMPPLASDAVSAPASESLASAASLKIPASVESYYGFTLGAEVRSRVAAYEEKTALQRKRQAKLWEEYLANNPSFEDRGQLKKLVRQGIPDHLRGRVWASFLGADVLLDSDPDAFERLQLEELPLDVSGQIELDLPRTFPNNKRKQELALASLLQLVVSTDKNKGLQIGQYYSNGMIDLRRDLKVLELLIRQKSPRVFQVLKKTGVEVEWLAAEWFLCLFCTSCPQPTVLRIWDCLMLEGPKILFRVALGIIFYFETQLAKMHSLEQVMGSLKAKLALLVEHNELLRLCFHKLRSFPRRRLQSLQETVAAGLVDPIQKAREQQQHQQQKQQQTASQDRRRRRLLSFKRNGGQQPASELEHPQAPSPQHVTWREKLSRVGRVGLKKKESQQANVQGNSSFEGNNAAQDVRSNSSAQQAIRSQAGIAVQQRAPSSSGGRPAEASRHPSRGLFAS